MLNKEKLFIIILVLAGFICYLNALPNNFLWDDEEQIVNNVFIKNWRNLPLVFSSSTFYSGQEKPWGAFYRPLVNLSYILNYSLWGLEPFGYHLFQIFFHLLNVILVFYVLRMIFEAQGIKRSDKISFFTALLFAIHPANVESVGYVASISEVLYVFFGLIGMFFFLKGIDYQRKNIKNSSLFLFSLFLFFGILAKESIVVIIPILFLYLLFFVRPNFKVYLKYILGSVLAVAFYFCLKIGLARMIGFSKIPFLSPISKASFFERLLTLPREIISYFSIIFFPKNLYIYRHFVVHSISDVKFWGSTILLLAIAIIFFYLARKGKVLVSLFFLLWFFCAIFPALNILMPFEMTIAERWLYFPIIGVFALVSYAIFQLLNNLKKTWQKSLIFGFIVIAILALSFRTIIRLSNWRDGLTLYGNDIKFSKNNFNLENNYGVELFRVGRFQEAKFHFQKSIDLEDKYYISHNNLGAVYEKEGDLKSALTEYQKSMELSDYYLAYENTASLLFMMGKEKEAKEFLEKAIQKFPSHSKLKLILAVIHYENNETSEAIKIIEEVLKSEPDNNLAKELLFNIQQGIKVY